MDVFEAYTVGWTRAMTGISTISMGQNDFFGFVYPSSPSMTCTSDHLVSNNFVELDMTMLTMPNAGIEAIVSLIPSFGAPSTSTE